MVNSVKQVFKATMVMVLACILIAAPHTEAVITCGQIVNSLTPCVPYLQNGGAVPPQCCAGVSSLNSAAKSTPDRQAACACLKRVATSMPGLNPNLASSLPGKCHVSIGYPISISVDCSKVK